MPKTRTKRSAQPDIWADEHLAEAPSPKSTAVRLSDKWQRVVRTYTKVSVFSFPIFAIVVLSLWSDVNAPVPVDTQKVANQVDSAGKTAAILAMNEWLDAKPAPLVNGRVVAWNGFDTKPKPKIDKALERDIVSPEYTIEVHHFTLVDGSGFSYTSEVAVAVDQVNGTSALSTPSLSPVAPAATGWDSSGTWFGLKTEQASEDVNVAVNQWAKAFTSGDPAVLRSTVGDGDPAHSYMPLTGVSGATPTVLAAASVPVIEDGVVSKKAAKQLIVQVRVQLEWAATGPAVPGDQNGDSSITYDLLIDKADTATPVVVSWGGAGSGTSLKAYDQAITDRELTKD